MNLLLKPEIWSDPFDNFPPIWWNSNEQRYEILISGSGQDIFYIEMSDEVAEEGDTIEFSYDVTSFSGNGSYNPTLMVERDGYINDFYEYIDETPSGTVSIECVAGSYYRILLCDAGQGHDYYSTFYDFEAVITPPVEPEPEPEPEPEVVKPWWLCEAKEPVTPCPVRPTNFVSLDQYDADFKFPLTSSRVPAKIVRPEECMVCRPTIINGTDPVDPPEDGCINIVFDVDYGCISSIAPTGVDAWPDWFSQDMGFDLELETPDGTVSAYYSPDFQMDPPRRFYHSGGGDLCGPLTGTGTLSQENTSTYEINSICVNYTINAGGE